MSEKTLKYILIDVTTESLIDTIPGYEALEMMLINYIDSNNRSIKDKDGKDVDSSRIYIVNEHMAFMKYLQDKSGTPYPSSLISMNTRMSHLVSFLLGGRDYVLNECEVVDYVVVFTDIAFKKSMYNLLIKPSSTIADSIDEIAKIITNELGVEIINYVAMDRFNILYIYDTIKDSISGIEETTGIRAPKVNKPKILH